MKTKVLILAIFSSLLCVVGCQNSPETSIGFTSKNSLVAYNLKGDISNIKISTFEAVKKNGEIAIGDGYFIFGINADIHFNELGNIVFWENRNSDGTSGRLEFYEYNGENKLECIRTKRLNNGEFIEESRTENRFANGFLSVARSVSTIDDDMFIGITVYCNNGIYITNIFDYAIYNDFKPTETKCIYDEKGKLKLETIYDENKDIATCRYYIDGFLHKVEEKNRTTVLIRDEKKEVIETEFARLSGLFDAYLPYRGRCVYKYNYDSNGNWVKRFEWKKAEDGTLTPWTITTREITYR